MESLAEFLQSDQAKMIREANNKLRDLVQPQDTCDVCGEPASDCRCEKGQDQ